MKRRTVALDEDVAAGLERLQRERGISFREAINSVLRAGLYEALAARAYRMPTYEMGVRPGVDIDEALALDAALEDEGIVGKSS